MPLKVNLRHLEAHEVALKGELLVEELEIDWRDDMLGAVKPLRYDLEIEKPDDNLLVRGSLKLRLECRCVRCLKPFKQEMKLDPWTCFVPLRGEEAAPIQGDCVDLTPYIREDILLELPQHPVCDQECRGLKKGLEKSKSKGADRTDIASSAWAELDKLKL